MSKLLTGLQKHELLSKILKRHKHYPSSVCALGVDEQCGLEQFAADHATWGIVTDKEQLAGMKSSFSQAKLYGQSFTGFRLPSKMQLIYQLSGMMHTVVGQPKREKMLEKLLAHLEPYGMVVFDLYLGSHFDHAMKHDGSVAVSDQQVSINARKEKKGVYTKKALTFTQQDSGLYERQETTESYQTFGMGELKKMLKVFESVEVLDIKGRKANAKTGHVVVVARKGW